MEITYELTPEDFWHFNVYYRRHKSVLRPWFRNPFLGVFVIIFLSGLWMIWDSWVRYGQIQWIFVTLLPAFAFYAYRLYPPTKKRVLKVAAQQPGLLCEHTIAISPKWLLERTAVNESKTAWGTVDSIEEDREYMYFFLTKANAYTVPKGAFSSLAAAQDFYVFAQHCWAAAKIGSEYTPDVNRDWPPAPQTGV